MRRWPRSGDDHLDRSKPANRAYYAIIVARSATQDTEGSRPGHRPVQAWVNARSERGLGSTLRDQVDRRPPLSNCPSRRPRWTWWGREIVLRRARGMRLVAL